MKNLGNFESIKKINKSQQTAENFQFSFKVISEREIKNAIKDLPIDKSTISDDIACTNLLPKTDRYNLMNL